MFLTAKIVQTECNKKKKPKFFRFLLLRCRLFYPKIVQTECNKKKKPKFFQFFIAEVPPILSKDSANRMQ